jgi:peptidoglycan/xylan/chitin deacetylase (PgdA/CDA1 family)
MISERKSMWLALTLCSLLVSLFGCVKYDRDGFMPKAGIALTFDDLYLEEWEKCLPLFDSFHVRATFYISNYEKFSAEQKRKLKELQDHGHEIAYHSTTHPDFVKYLNRHSILELDSKEIQKGLALMNADGFYPKAFAYPYGSHNDLLDHWLLKRFSSVRALNGTKDQAKSYTCTVNNSVLYAMGMDLSSGKTSDELVDMVYRANSHDNCLVLVGHHITQMDTKMRVPFARLKRIIQTAHSLHMKFYTVSEISRQ